MTKEKLLELLKEDVVNIQKFFEFSEGDSDLIVVKDKNSDIFYMTILNADNEAAKYLMRKALSYYDFITPEKITLDNIYDIESVTSAKSLEELFGKMLFLINGLD